MSIEAARVFVQAVLNDEELRRNTANMKPEEVIAFAKEMGFDFTLDELKEVKKDDIELSPDELEAVAGGHHGGSTGISTNHMREVLDFCEKSRHCNFDVRGPYHNWVVVGHKEEPILGGWLSWAGDWSKGYDILKCTLCGIDGKREV